MEEAVDLSYDRLLMNECYSLDVVEKIKDFSQKKGNPDHDSNYLPVEYRETLDGTQCPFLLVSILNQINTISILLP